LSADRSELLLVRGEGYRVWDAEGREYLDASSAALHAVCGYAHPVLTEAVSRQLSRLHHFDLSRASHEPAGLLAERLASHLPAGLSKTLFVNSGSEGFDAAALIAAGYWSHLGTPRTRMVAFTLGYHGATVLSRSLSGLPRNRHPLRSPLPVSLVDLPFEPRRMREPEALGPLLAGFAAAIADGEPPAAVVVEPFLNVGGGVALPEGFLPGLRALCD
jgi:adenosylmethionine-8-amino-7-oxononanoate aminotransferase